MNQTKRQRKGTRLWLLLPLAVGALSLLAFGLWGANWLDADMASEMVLSDLLNREGRALTLTPNWIYSSELRIVSPVPLYRLGLALFSSWHAARVFACGVMMVLVLTAFLYMAAPCGLNACGAFAASVVLLPFSLDYAQISLYGSYYGGWLALVFVLLGLLMRLDRPQGRGRRFALIALLGLYGGLGGVRMGMVLLLPLGLAIAAEILTRVSCGASLREALDVRARGAVLLACCALLGLLLNSAVLAHRFTFDGHAGTPIVEPDAELAWMQVTGLLSFFGFREAEALFSIWGLCSLAALAALPLAGWLLCRQVAHRETLPPANRLLTLYAFFGLLCGVGLNLATENVQPHYFLPALLALVAVVDQTIARAAWPRGLRTAAAALLCGVMALSAGVTVRNELGMETADYVRAADWLTANGYTQGYATFWNGATLTEASDGALEVWTLEEPTWSDAWKRLTLNAYLQETRHLSEAPEGPVFLLLTPDEAAQAPALADSTRLVYEDGSLIYAYESADALAERVQ